MWDLAEPQLFRMEPLCGNLLNLNFSEWNLYVEPCGTSTFQNGTFMWDLAEPQLFRMEPLRGTSRNLVQDFGRLPQTTPKLFLEPRLFFFEPKTSCQLWPEDWSKVAAPELEKLGGASDFGGSVILFLFLVLNVLACSFFALVFCLFLLFLFAPVLF